MSCPDRLSCHFIRKSNVKDKTIDLHCNFLPCLVSGSCVATVKEPPLFLALDEISHRRDSVVNFKRYNAITVHSDGFARLQFVHPQDATKATWNLGKIGPYDIIQEILLDCFDHREDTEYIHPPLLISDKNIIREERIPFIWSRWEWVTKMLLIFS